MDTCRPRKSKEVLSDSGRKIELAGDVTTWPNSLSAVQFGLSIVRLNKMCVEDRGCSVITTV